MATEEGISIAELARRAGMHENSIRYQLKKGTLTTRPDGKMNPSDVAKLQKVRRVSVASDKNSANLLRVRVLGGAVKARRLRLTLAEAQQRVVERDSLSNVLTEAAGKILGRVAAWPTRYTPTLVHELTLDPDDAQAVLGELTTVALAELGAIAQEMVAVCQTK
jgi:hypothetical protein